MRTDIPLKRLTLLRPADLLPLLGIAAAQVIAVESLELPASATRLDNVLRLRSGRGQEYLHVVEWQGYHDPGMLWRFVGYLAWLGQRHPNTAVAGTLIYLTPADDTGNTLRQEVDEQVVLDWQIPCVRLWEQDAPAALASGNLGLTVLSPLMRNATEALVERERYVRMVGRENLMASDLLTYLMEEKLAEVRAEKDGQLAQLQAEREIERATEQARALRQLQQTLEEAVIARFPEAPIALVHDIQRVIDSQQLQQLIIAVIRAADLAEFEHSLAQAAHSASRSTNVAPAQPNSAA